MAPIKFARAILAGEPIDVFNNGQHARDFTYIDDVVEGVLRTADRIPQPNPDWDGLRPDPATSSAPYRIYNIGNQRPIELMHFIGVLEKALGREAIKNFLPQQPGDVPTTFADVDDLIADVGFAPSTTLEEGIPRFVDWYRSYYGS
jgi:UDP-glucuronate 4-epimerase